MRVFRGLIKEQTGFNVALAVRKSFVKHYWIAEQERDNKPVSAWVSSSVQRTMKM
jgi:hypothetical protein